MLGCLGHVSTKPVEQEIERVVNYKQTPFLFQHHLTDTQSQSVAGNNKHGASDRRQPQRELTVRTFGI